VLLIAAIALMLVLLTVSDRALGFAVSRFRHHFPIVHEDKSMVQPFEGVRELLLQLHEAGVFVSIVSSKIRATVEAQLSAFGLASLIDHIGCTDDHRGGNKEALLQMSLERLGVDRDKAVMVGDRHFDLNAANALHMDSIGVLYGYGSEEELQGCSPTHLVKSVRDLEALLLS